jgi:hypothetical protein
MDIASNSENEPETAFSKIDLILTLAFTLELLLNAFANWLRPFVTNGWSMFDFFIVTLSLVSLAVDGVPVRLILLLRCCRVLRIFGKLPSVAKIFAALFQSLIPMLNAFFIIFIIAALCEAFRCSNFPIHTHLFCTLNLEVPQAHLAIHPLRTFERLGGLSTPSKLCRFSISGDEPRDFMYCGPGRALDRGRQWETRRPSQTAARGSKKSS